MIQGIMTFSSFSDTEALKDADIIARVQKEPELFATIVHRYEQALLRRASKILKNPRDAEEVVQDAFTKMYLYADKYSEQEGASFSSWAYTILNRVAYTKYTIRRKEQGRYAELEPEHYEAFPDTHIDFIENLSLRDEVVNVMAKLPETVARVLRLQFIEGKSQKEIAQSEGLSISAVKTRIHRAKKLFKEIYNKQHHK